MAKFEQSPYPVESILQELRGADGELYRYEVSQRLYLIVKGQILDSLYSLWKTALTQPDAKQQQNMYSRGLQAYDGWTRAVRDEEMKTLFNKHSDIESIWKDVAMIYIRLCNKYTDAKSVKIRNPDVEELIRNFVQHIIKTPWCKSGELSPLPPEACQTRYG